MAPYVEELCRRLLLRVRTPGLPYRWSANLYRGGRHPCAYCLSTGRHELRGHAGMAGFEARVVVKPNAPAVLRGELEDGEREAGVIGLGAAYDPYGPAELCYRLTQRALAVALAAGRPVCVVTNSALVLRDLPLLSELAQGPGVQVIITLCSDDEAVGRHVEPEASTPAGRLKAIALLQSAGVPVGLALAPIIPDLTDGEEALAGLAAAAAASGARFLLPPVPRMEHGGVEWALPGIRMLHPHLPAQYMRRYRGPYRPERYTQEIAAMLERLRHANGLAEGVIMAPPRVLGGQLPLQV
jgi:DNA repair photolyase